MKALIHDSFPSHDIFGEETGMEPGKQPEENTDPKYLWVIDPIDGTKCFITGVTALNGCRSRSLLDPIPASWVPLSLTGAAPNSMIADAF